MGPSVKFVLAIIDSISKKKWGLIFFLAKLDTEGGSEGFVSVDAKITDLNFGIFPLFEVIANRYSSIYER